MIIFLNFLWELIKKGAKHNMLWSIKVSVCRIIHFCFFLFVTQLKLSLNRKHLQEDKATVCLNSRGTNQEASACKWKASYWIKNKKRGRLLKNISGILSHSWMNDVFWCFSCLDSLYWESWRSCPSPRESPPLPQAKWAWRGAERGEGGRTGK